MKIYLKLKKVLLLLVQYIFWKLGVRHYMPLRLWALRKGGMNIEGRPRYISFTVSFDGTDYSIISIGNDTVISSDVRILTHDYSIMRAAYACDKKPDKLFRIVKPVTVGNNCFIGTKTILCPGTTIGDNVIIGAASVVTGAIPSNSVAAGNPAKVIASIEEHYQKRMEKDQEYIVVEKCT